MRRRITVATDYIAHAVYGVEVDDDDMQRIVASLARCGDDDNEDEDDEKWPHLDTEVIRDLEKNDPTFFDDLKAKYDAPESSLYWSGDEDDRPGRCDTSTDVWLFGVGLLDFPLEEGVSSKFRERAEWYCWVTAG
jgi:hypothetical protein